MKKRENKNLKIPGISITYYVITALYMFIGLILLSMNTCFAKLDFFKNSSQVNVITMALTLISIGLAMFGLGYSFYTNNKSDNEDEYNTISSHDENKSSISVKTATITICLIVFLSLMLIFTGFWFYHNGWINGTQLGYAGAIIGGGITLLGVYITIVYTENSRKEDQQRHDQDRREDLANQYKPYISLIPQKNLQNEGIDINDYVKYDKINKKYHFEIVYKNIGRGDAKNLRIQIYSGNINIYDSKKEYIDVFPDNLLHRIQFSMNDDFIDYKTTRTFKVIFSYKDGFSFYQYEMHYYIQYVIQNKQIISYSVSLDHKSSKTQRIENKKSKNESEE